MFFIRIVYTLIMDDLQKWFLEHEEDGSADKSLEELVAGFSGDDYAISSEGFRAFRKQIRKENPWWKQALRVVEHAAAALFLPAVLASALILFDKKPEQVRWSEIYTRSGQTRTLALPDGSTIRLAPESHIVYPSAFKGNLRQIFLQGEAYADIVHMEECPFEIHSEDITVKVMGTEFNFSSYQTDAECELALVDGIVEMTIVGKDSNHDVKLKTGDLVHYNRATGSVEKQRFSPDSFIANNLQGGLQFSNRRMEDIAHCLERKFGAKIIIEDEAIAEERFFASFINGEDLPTILQSLNTQNHMYIQRRGDVYTLSLMLKH